MGGLNLKLKFLFVASAFSLLIISCSKKDSNPTPVSMLNTTTSPNLTTTSPIISITSSFSYTVNGKSYNANNKVNIQNPFSSSSTSFSNISIPSGGGYFGASSNTTQNGISIYELLIAGVNISGPKDTVGVSIGLASTSPLVPGTYTVTPTTGLRQNTGLTFAIAGYVESGVTGSAGTEGSSGIVTLTSIDSTNHKANGTFNFNGTYKNTSSVSTPFSVTNGVFTNISFQKF